jgi:hypothetical protein
MFIKLQIRRRSFWLHTITETGPRLGNLFPFTGLTMASFIITSVAGYISFLLTIQPPRHKEKEINLYNLGVLVPLWQDT